MLEIILKQFRAILKQELKQSVLEINRELRTGEAFIRTDLALLRRELKINRSPKKLTQPVSVTFLGRSSEVIPKSYRNQ